MGTTTKVDEKKYLMEVYSKINTAHLLHNDIVNEERERKVGEFMDSAQGELRDFLIWMRDAGWGHVYREVLTGLKWVEDTQTLPTGRVLLTELQGLFTTVGSAEFEKAVIEKYPPPIKREESDTNGGHTWKLPIDKPVQVC